MILVSKSCIHIANNRRKLDGKALYKMKSKEVMKVVQFFFLFRIKSIKETRKRSFIDCRDEESFLRIFSF